jgi:hypothetical protein
LPQHKQQQGNEGGPIAKVAGFVGLRVVQFATPFDAAIGQLFLPET